MGYWGVHEADARALIEGWIASQGERRLVVLDGGAAGGLSEPFDRISDVVTAVRFEPRGEGVLESVPDEVVIDGALWSHDEIQHLNVAERASTSSMYRPNSDLLARYDDYYGLPPRIAVSTKRVTCRSVDSCVAGGEMPAPDAIKLDIHGSELPALMGAEQSIVGTSMLIVETWNAEVHLGQGLHHEVESWAYDHGFELFDYKVAAAWRHKHNGGICKSDKPQVVGTEALFIRSNRDLSQDLVASSAFFLGLFGYLNAALEALEVGQNTFTQGLDRLQEALLFVQASRTKRNNSLPRRLAQRVRPLASRLLTHR